MCKSTVDLQSTTDENRRGKKEELRKKEETTGVKYNGPCALPWAAIITHASSASQSKSTCYNLRSVGNGLSVSLVRFELHKRHLLIEFYYGRNRWGHYIFAL